MKVGVVIYSETGNTLSVAQGIIDRLTLSGNTAVLERIKPIGKPNPSSKKVDYESIPDISDYEALVFGSPVQAFSLALGMSRLIPQLKPMAGRRAVMFITQQFPYPWMGGSRAIAAMATLLKQKGAVTSSAGIVNWSNKNRDEMISSVIDDAVRQLLV